MCCVYLIAGRKVAEASLDMNFHIGEFTNSLLLFSISLIGCYLDGGISSYLCAPVSCCHLSFDFGVFIFSSPYFPH